tara:strand:+ start:1223 stop:2146 length:924 start_codon:yes stop_codon:yes gene_type:complete
MVMKRLSDQNAKHEYRPMVTMLRMTCLQRPGRWSTISCLLAVGFVIIGMAIPRLALAETPADQASSEAASVLPKDSPKLESEDSWVESALTNYGPWLLFGLLMASGVGMALGEDAFIIPAGFLMERELMPFWWTIAAAYFGVVFADTLWMLVVRQFSGTIMRFRFFRRMFHPRRILEIKYKFDRWGTWVVVLSRFIPFSRTPVFTAAGLARMKIWKFMIAESLSALPVVGMQLGFGWLISKGVSMTAKQKHVQETIFFSIILAIILVMFWFWWRRKKLKIKAPRAPAAWLREVMGPTAHRSISKSDS